MDTQEKGLFRLWAPQLSLMMREFTSRSKIVDGIRVPSFTQKVREFMQWALFFVCLKIEILIGTRSLSAEVKRKRKSHLSPQ